MGCILYTSSSLLFQTAVKLFKKNGIYLDINGDIRCFCSNKPIINWDKNKFTRHFKQDGHKECVARRELGGKQDSRVSDHFDAERKEKESERLSHEGTRATEAVNKDIPFRERLVKAFSAAGIPLAKAEKLREWLESEVKRSIGHPSMLPEHIPALLEKEEWLQEEILRVAEYIGIIFDATPRQGDFFAMIARFVRIDEEKRTAVAVQELIHCEAIKGSLDQNGLLGEVAKGLSNRGIKARDAVVGMNDGCYTNGATHNRMNVIAELSGVTQRFISLCISHCLANAGMYMCILFGNFPNIVTHYYLLPHLQVIRQNLFSWICFGLCSRKSLLHLIMLKTSGRNTLVSRSPPTPRLDGIPSLTSLTLWPLISLIFSLLSRKFVKEGYLQAIHLSYWSYSFMTRRAGTFELNFLHMLRF